MSRERYTPGYVQAAEEMLKKGESLVPHHVSAIVSDWKYLTDKVTDLTEENKKLTEELDVLRRIVRNLK